MGFYEDSMPREVENLSNYDEETHLEALRQGDLEKYENEYALIEDSLDLPQKFLELNELEQTMIILFIDKDYIDPNSGQHTENEHFYSFLAAYPNQKVTKKIYKIVETINSNGVVEISKEVNPESLLLYRKMKTHAVKIWKENNLKEVSKSMREIMTNSGFRNEELLEQTILSDALSKEQNSFTMQNRRLAVDIKGMKKPQGLQSINVFLKGGGQEASKVITESSGNEAFDLVPEEELEEVEIVKDNEQ